MKRKFFLKTFGCQMNMADSERMGALLSEQGWVPVEAAKEADIIVLNGCSVREKAVHKAVSSLGQFREEGIENKVFAMGGCVGQLEKDSLFQRFPFLDFVFGPDTLDQLPEMIYLADQGHKHKLYTEFDKELGYRTETKLAKKSPQAFVNIMKGCDKFCTYCIVPFTRGREKSRSIDEVLDDVANLVSQGVSEVTLLGQNVNSFGKGNPNLKNREPKELHSPLGKVGPRASEENFPQLLHAMEHDSRLGNLKRIRFTSSHPLDFSDELLRCYAPSSDGGLTKLASQLHLPVQSGSNSMLQRMGRHHKIETYIEQMDLLRKIAPRAGVTTDLIVGFPGETEEEFQATLSLLERMQYDSVFAFMYSERPGTRAAKLEDDIPQEEKSRRLNLLLQVQKEISRKRFAEFVGKTVEVLVEGEAKNQFLSERSPGLRSQVFTGRTSCGKIVNFLSNRGETSLVGRYFTLKITKASALALQGELVHDAELAEQSTGENTAERNQEALLS